MLGMLGMAGMELMFDNGLVMASLLIMSCSRLASECSNGSVNVLSMERGILLAIGFFGCTFDITIRLAGGWVITGVTGGATGGTGVFSRGGFVGAGIDIL